MSKIAAYIRRHHIGLLALLVATTGTAVAATKIGPNEIAKNAVRGYHVKNGQLGVKDLRKIKTTDQVTKLIPDSIANDNNWGVGIARTHCPKGSLAIGIRTDWLAGNAAVRDQHSSPSAGAARW